MAWLKHLNFYWHIKQILLWRTWKDKQLLKDYQQFKKNYKTFKKLEKIITSKQKLISLMKKVFNWISYYSSLLKIFELFLIFNIWFYFPPREEFIHLHLLILNTYFILQPYFCAFFWNDFQDISISIYALTLLYERC